MIEVSFHNHKYPAMLQINTRVWLTELSRKMNRSACLDDIPDAEIDHWAELGFDWIWMLSVWQTGPQGQMISRTNEEWRNDFKETLPDLREDDIGGSGFAITGYTVHTDLGGDEALARLRERLRRRGFRLMLDFVPNHTGLDHSWVEDHPEYYVSGTELDLVRTPQNYTWVKRERGDLLLACGRDPYFPGWPDTIQLNYGNPATQDAMLGELLKIAGQCDGVRCDMAMLVLPDIFERTWNIPAQPFWPKATTTVRSQFPGFMFMAEVYWDLEWTLQQQGFDYTYDKRLYDRLRDGHIRPVREHFFAGLEFQNKLARFLENHDEPRAASTFSSNMHEAAAVITFLSPGLRFFHQGQLQGRRKRISPHLIRGPEEPVDQNLEQFYTRLLGVMRHPVIRDGQWQLLDCQSAWENNWTSDCFLAFAWQNNGDERLIIVVNYAPNQSQCFVHLPFLEVTSGDIIFKDLMGPSTYSRKTDEIASQGLYLDLPAWGYHVFEVTRQRSDS